jgi:hypothetical protein
MFRFGHRISKDIDIFTSDAQALSFITPRLNETAEREASDDEEQANAIKLILPAGDIDFIVAGQVTQLGPTETLDFDGRAILLEPTAEILAKKRLYRADGFKARDVFDMAACIALDPAAAVQALSATRRTRQVLRQRLATMRSLPQEELTRDIAMTESGRAYVGGMLDAVMKMVADVDARPG